jgi:hypothetical protein
MQLERFWSCSEVGRQIPVCRLPDWVGKINCKDYASVSIADILNIKGTQSHITFRPPKDVIET